MRTDSSADAHRKISRPLNSRVSRLRASMTRTPDARPLAGSYITLCTTLCGRSVILPVAAAAGRVAASEEK